jgi:glycosyl hydrolase family 26
MRRTPLLLVVIAAALIPAAPAEAKRATGVYVDPWHVAEWAHNVGLKPQFVGRFEAFSRNAALDSFVAEAERQGLRRVLVAWEPWKPVPTGQGPGAQFRPQPGYTNAEIAAGSQDAYITRFAQALARFHGRVDLRYAHEMNGTWYPWSHDPIGYRAAWRHIVTLFRAAGATNVKFVWSPNPSLFLSFRTWRRSVRVYWPGRRYVDAVGVTMINFGGTKRYPVKRFVPRFKALRRMYRKPLILAEVNTAHRGRVRWLRDLRRMLRRTPYIKAVALFQHQSRGQALIEGTGRLDWDVQRDPRAAAVLRAIARDGRRGARR